MKDEILEINWRNGSRFKVAATEAHDLLERLRTQNGGALSPAVVVAEASKKRSPIHGEFEWNDAVAAGKQREHRARVMIGSIHVVRAAAPKVTARRYEVTSAPPVEGERPSREYKTTEQIMADPEARDKLLTRACRELLTLRERYHGLTELQEVFAQVDKAFKKHA